MYTSGCPKNQNKCWYKIGSPPPLGSKKHVLKFRSLKIMVMAPASTGRDRRRRIVVIRIDQANKGICSSFIFLGRMFHKVEMKLIAPKMEEIPARCSLKIVKSTDRLLWNIILARGG